MTDHKCNLHKVRDLYEKFKEIRNVNEFTRKTCAIATVFKRECNDFVRISTTLRTEDGQLATHTTLNPADKPYNALIQGEGFEGIVYIYGKYHCVKMEPFITSGKNETPIIVVGVGYVIDEVDECDELRQRKYYEVDECDELKAKKILRSKGV
jgi:hypothetical protein